MATLDAATFDLGRLDSLSRQDTPVHRLDPRAKLVTTLVFILTVVSFGKYEVTGLAPFFLFPIVMAAIARVPFGYLLKKTLLVAPFVVLVGVFNPFLDRVTLLHLGPIAIAGGWVSFASLLLRFVLTVSAAFLLIATAGILEICLALEQLRAPRPFAVQVLFLYRYLFVLVAEAGRLVRARALRSFNGRGREMKTAAGIIGHLLLRTLNRARRIHQAMQCRAFTGEIRLRRQPVFTGRDFLFTTLWSLIFITMRCYNIPQQLGTIIIGILS